MELKTCANEECKKSFSPNVHNAIYCSAECRRVETNKKVLEKYYEKKEKKAAKKRICINRGCKTILSSYNPEDICEPCQTERLIQRLIGWGWEETDLRKSWSY